MSEVSKQYVLRQPVQVDLALNVDDHVAVYVDPYIECFEMRLASFESAFVSVEDIQPELRHEIAEMINLKVGDLAETQSRSDTVGLKILFDLVDEIIGVFYGKEKP